MSRRIVFKRVHRNKTWVILVFTALVVFAIFAPQINKVIDLRAQCEAIFGNLGSFITITLAIISAVLIWIELKETKKIQEAEFVLSLNQSYVENQTYAKVYTCLEKHDIEGIKPCLDRIEISNYLTFFEAMYLLLKKRVINLKVLNDLFSYRFFLAVHSEVVQNEKLLKYPDNFRNIYKLEKEWIDYRMREGLNIYKEEKCLGKMLDKNKYREIINN